MIWTVKCKHTTDKLRFLCPKYDPVRLRSTRHWLHPLRLNGCNRQSAKPDVSNNHEAITRVALKKSEKAFKDVVIWKESLEVQSREKPPEKLKPRAPSCLADQKCCIASNAMTRMQTSFCFSVREPGAALSLHAIHFECVQISVVC